MRGCDIVCELGGVHSGILTCYLMLVFLLKQQTFFTCSDESIGLLQKKTLLSLALIAFFQKGVKWGPVLLHKINLEEIYISSLQCRKTGFILMVG